MASRLVAQWQRGNGAYPYRTRWPLAHHAWSRAVGAAYGAGMALVTRRLARPLDIMDPHGWLRHDAQPFIGVGWHRWAAMMIELWWREQSGLPVFWLNLMEPRMGPTHELCARWAGVEMVLTDGGFDSRASADLIADMLRARECHSTAVMPDGPSGPPRTFRKGALYMALRSGCPLVPLHFSSSGTLKMGTWDRKEIRVPGSRVRVALGDAVWVRSEHDFGAAQQRLVEQMDVPF